jgi:hypothetical protein
VRVNEQGEVFSDKCKWGGKNRTKMNIPKEIFNKNDSRLRKATKGLLIKLNSHLALSYRDINGLSMTIGMTNGHLIKFLTERV